MQGTSHIQAMDAAASEDLADEVKGMYRVLDLISESGTNGYGKEGLQVLGGTVASLVSRR